MATRLTEYGRIVHYADGYAVTWNGSATFNVYSKVSGRLFAEDCFTVYGVTTVDAAMDEAWIWAGSE